MLFTFKQKKKKEKAGSEGCNPSYLDGLGKHEEHHGHTGSGVEGLLDEEVGETVRDRVHDLGTLADDKGGTPSVVTHTSGLTLEDVHGLLHHGSVLSTDIERSTDPAEDRVRLLVWRGRDDL